MNEFTLRHPNMLDKLLNFFKYVPIQKYSQSLSEKQKADLQHLREHGYVCIEDLISPEQLKSMQDSVEQKFKAGQIEFPLLAQTKIDPHKHKTFINNFLYASPSYLRELNLAAEKKDFNNYDQFLSEFKPSTLALPIPDEQSIFFQVWLNEYLLDIIEGYMGLKPTLLEAYIRRNFPSPYRTMNHFWHRDLNDRFHLVKAFIFLSDCDLNSGPHEFVSGSHTDFSLNSKRYYSDEEIEKNVAPGAITKSLVKAGTIILEDTRGLHKAAMPEIGYRDLGYAVFAPIPWFRNYRHKNYSIRMGTFNKLSARQQNYISDVFIGEQA